MKKNLKLISVGLLASMILCASSGVYARDNWAYAAGLTYDRTGNIFNMDSYNACYNALLGYQNAGYSVGGYINPDRTTLWENLYATVQFFRGHGSTQHINFLTTGIHNGGNWVGTVTDSKDTFNVDLIGTDLVHWYADTILVTYAACNCAGEKGVVASDSVARSTAARGADVVMGFTDQVQDGSSEHWTDRYNQKLGEGYGVNDALKYANSFNYLFGGVKNNTLWHRGDDNIKIGKYGSTSKNMISEKMKLSSKVSQYVKGNISIKDNTFTNTNLLKDKSMEDRNVLKIKNNMIASEENIKKELKNIYNNFNEENYTVEKYTSSRYNVNTNEKTDEYIYYDYKLKIGDYITDAAYTVVVKDNKIDAIYDNNVDLDKQEELLKNSYLLKVNTDNNIISELDSKTERYIKEKYNDNSIVTTNKEYTYYYDIKNDKKYIVSSYTTEKQLEGLENTIAINNYKYEIK